MNADERGSDQDKNWTQHRSEKSGARSFLFLDLIRVNPRLIVLTQTNSLRYKFFAEILGAAFTGRGAAW